MIRIIVELVPHGFGKPEELGRIVIANDGSLGNGELGNYDVALGRKGQSDDHKIFDKPQRSGRVENHRRKAESIWSLVTKALNSVGFKGERDAKSDKPKTEV